MNIEDLEQTINKTDYFLIRRFVKRPLAVFKKTKWRQDNVDSARCHSGADYYAHDVLEEFMPPDVYEAWLGFAGTAIMEMGNSLGFRAVDSMKKEAKIISKWISEMDKHYGITKGAK